jgi:hypothetical protein
MKNVYLLPTDKPSRIGYLTKKGKEVFNHLVLFDRMMPIILDSENQHIYITSDEEITGFEHNIWVIKGERIFLWQNTMALVSDNKPRKTILTTDPDLIECGIQSIGDEFLEWFVKNSNCEWVEVLYDYFQVDQNNPVLRGSTSLVKQHKIIIPQEEPK